MIIGKSLTALGGGGLKPEICVTAKAGALLNLHYKDSSIILQSYQLGAEETQHTFVVNVSETTYVVEDVTNGKSVEVLVDAVAMFEADIAYVLWLYKDGDECEGITGSWIDGGYNGTSTGGMTKNSDCLTLKHPVNGAQQARTINKIDLTKYTTVFAEVITSTDNYSSALIRIQSGESYSDNSEVTPGDASKVTTKTVFQTDISSLEGSYYVKPTLYWGSYANFYRIWLE